MGKTPHSGGDLKHSYCTLPSLQPLIPSLLAMCRLDILTEELQNAKALGTCKDKRMKYFYLNTVGSKHNLPFLNVMYFQIRILVIIPII